MFLNKKYKNQKHILTISNDMNMSLPPPCFTVLKMYIQRLNYQVFPMKTSQTLQIWTKCVENKWEGNRVPLDCTLTKEPQNFFHILCDMGLPCSKLNSLNLIKDRNKLFFSFQKVHKHSLIQNELVSTFTLKKISNYTQKNN